MAYIIEGFVETLSSDGTFTIHGSEGFVWQRTAKPTMCFGKIRKMIPGNPGTRKVVP